MELKTVRIEKPEDMNFILGQAHFIKTVEDLHEAIVTTAPHIKFGLAFCESSGPSLVRFSGNDAGLVEIAQRNALALAAGHAFIIFLKDGFPVNILNAVKDVPEVCRVFCATA
ncbi:MAG: adenosine-specific kinase, partial [Candidatus Aminicenantes bacterium]|nr:adenosine-specific kinase [Candidatus Aminicenantes bacterium]